MFVVASSFQRFMWSKKHHVVSIADKRLDVDVFFVWDPDGVVIHVPVNFERRVTSMFFLAVFAKNCLGVATVISLRLSGMFRTWGEKSGREKLFPHVHHPG
jgi:hypothetical protein